MFSLKPLSTDAIPAALGKAERYRLLNEPGQAESICLDVLAIDAGNERALVTLVLALSDQFGERMVVAYPQAEARVAELPTAYAREYYGALLCERRARAHRKRGGTASGPTAHGWLLRALAGFERAIALREPDNDDAIVRWNTCVRMLANDPGLKAAPVDTFHPLLE
jgi:hypothetical protein